jgi:hypothetical protein
VLGIGDDGEALRFRRDLVQELHPLADQRVREEGDAGKAPARARQTLRDSGLQRVAAVAEHHGRGPGQLAGDAQRRALAHVEGGVRPRRLQRELLQPLERVVAPELVEREVPAGRIAEERHALEERLEERFAGCAAGRA